jgi:hypothetical protein
MTNAHVRRVAITLAIFIGTICLMLVITRPMRGSLEERVAVDSHATAPLAAIRASLAQTGAAADRAAETPTASPTDTPEPTKTPEETPTPKPTPTPTPLPGSSKHRISKGEYQTAELLL